MSDHKKEDEKKADQKADAKPEPKAPPVVPEPNPHAFNSPLATTSRSPAVPLKPSHQPVKVEEKDEK